ncbi:hypothetical protein ACA910_018501 [Epithemia clementina (nom. ined.)]
MSRRRKRDDDDALDDDDDDDEDDEDDVAAASKKRKKKKGGFLDDAAVESGEEDNEDEDEDDDEDNNEYVKDGFLVDEDEDEEIDKPKEKDDLEDSDEDDDDDDDDDDDRAARKKQEQRKKSRLTKLKQTERLAEEDLELIREAQGLGPSVVDRAAADALEERPAVQHIRARNEAELQKTLFDGDDDDGVDTGRPSKQPQPSFKNRRRPAASDYDEDGMDDFIEDDLNDQDDIRASEQRGMMDDDGYGGNEVSEAQLAMASEIFGTDYLDFMNRDGGGDDGEEDDLMGRRRERGIDYGYGDDDEADESDEGSLFGDGEDEDDIDLDGLSAQQKAEALKLKREKAQLAKQERRRKAQQAKTEKRKAQLRRVFEPVQLIENFCTERDDLIRQTDVPERLFGWDETSFYGPAEYDGKSGNNVDAVAITETERKQAEWIAQRIPAIAEEFHNSTTIDGVVPMDLGEVSNKQYLPHQEAILTSISYALRYIHRDKFEPAFIKRYRKDYITSKAVREHLYEIIEEDIEWDRLIKARVKVQELLSSITRQADGDAKATVDSDRLVELRQKLEDAKQSLEDSQARASDLKTELEALNKKKGDDDDDQLFDDDDEEDEAEKAKQKAHLASSLKDVQDLVTLRTDRVSELQSQLDLVEAQNRALNEKGPHMERVMTKMRRQSLWNDKDYREHFLTKAQDAKEIVDLNGYLHLIQEGNEAIKKKEVPILAATGSKESRQRRSRRFDRDYYRTCVAEGLRAVCYKFLLPPNRVGIKLQDQFQNAGGDGAFDFTRTMPGEEDKSDPLQWVPPQIPQSPSDFCNELIGSGELVLLSSSGANSNTPSGEDDPLRGCRYVAALELASEPRVRKFMRQLFRQNALLTTRPTAKGLEELDAFHDYYGLHLIRNKPALDHFPPILVETPDQIRRRAHMSPAERNEFDNNRKQHQIDSCLQFLNIIKAAQGGFLTFYIHLPLLNDTSGALDTWYRPDNKAFTGNRADYQNLEILASAFERVYLPPDGDTDAWNEERKQVVRLALNNFLLPYLEAELRRDLVEIASRIGVQAAAASLREMAMEGPYRPDRQQPPGLYYNESRFIVPTGDLSVVGYCCAPEGSKDASYFAHVSQHGKAEDFLAVPSGTRVESGKMREKVILFLIKARPAVVVVGTSGGFESRIIYRRLTDLIHEAKQRWSNRFVQGDDEDDEAFRARQDDLAALTGTADFDDDVEWKCDVELIDDKVAQLFGRSVRSKKEFPDFPVNHKSAIAIARYAKDPLAELTYTWSVASDAGMFGTEMLYFNIHPLQQLLPRSMLLREYERVLCDVTAEVGADINAACGFDHLCGLLMFTPGLGPRKAANLKQMISDRSGGVVSRRRDLLEDRLMGPVVYNNAVAFLRIQQTDQLLDQHLHPLDNTRLHPAIYVQHDWAVKISFDALERENVKTKAIKALIDAMSNSQQEVARLLEATQAEWERNFQSPFRFKEWDPRVNVPAEHWGDEIGNLDLDAFANAIERKGQGRWHSHFEMLLWEFRLPFFDPRKPMEPLEGEKLFRLITGESDQSLRPGKELTGKVVSNGEFGSRVKLEGDIPAFIPLRNLSDEHVEAPEDVVSPGQVVTAVVTEVKKDHMTVDMSLRMEDFRKNPSSWERPASLPPFDPYFDMGAATRIEEDNNKKREAHLEALQLALNRGSGSGDPAAEKKRKKRVARRACTHPAFRNARQDEVDRELREAGAAMVGQALIRPSTKQSDSLAIHWVVKEGSIKVIEVVEEDKETDAAIGNTLKIKDETYGSIDELLGRYIEPLNDLVDELQNHRKFVDLSEDETDDKLKAEKRKNPSSIPYALCWKDETPGYACLRFIMNTNPYMHLIGFSPKGFTWSSKVFMTIDQLLNDFKKNPRGVRPASSSQSSSAVRSARPAPPIAPLAPPPGGAMRSAIPPPRPAPPPPKPNRWGTKPPTPVGAAPSASPWQQQQQPPPPPRAAVTGTVSGWGSRPPPPPPAAPTGWSQQSQQQPLPPPRPPPPRPPVPPPQNLPPPPYVPAPNMLRQSAPPPPMIPQPGQQQRPPPPPPAPAGYGGQPPPPPRPAGQPPAFASAPPQQSVGRGRGRTLPAWMAKQKSEA